MEDSNYSSSKNYSYGNNRSNSNNNAGLIIKKGPWKPEEDQVLVNHVKKYGPRDWSSIRSKGLLQRTGKSCRLRWVNKLRPDLKNGCKFTAEEERVVMELQSQLGNKWATIATHLSGRTDNDVKNFWSSKQKRLKRILESDSPQPHNRSKTTSTTNVVATRKHSLFLEVHKSSVADGETSSYAQSLSSTSEMATIHTNNSNQMTTTNTECRPTSKPTNNEFNLDPLPLNEFQLDEMLFPPVPAFSSSFLHNFGCTYETTVFSDDRLQVPSCCCDGVMSGPTGVTGSLDSFFDDLPPDVFDQIEPLPSHSSW